MTNPFCSLGENALDGGGVRVSVYKRASSVVYLKTAFLAYSELIDMHQSFGIQPAKARSQILVHSLS